MWRKTLLFYTLNILVNIAAEAFLRLRLLSEFEPWIASVCISKYKIAFPVYLVLISSPFPDLEESVMSLFSFGVAGTQLVFYKPWLNLIQGQLSFQPCWVSQWAFKPVFTVTDHLEVQAKLGRKLQNTSSTKCKHFSNQVSTNSNKTLYVNTWGGFPVEREEDRSV